MGWSLGAVGVGAAGYVLIQSTQPPAAPDPRVRVALPSDPNGFFTTIALQGRPVGVRGLTATEAATLNLAPGALRFIALDLVCTQPQGGFVVGPRTPTADDRASWICPCCGSRYTLAGKPYKGPAKLNLKVPPQRFLDRRTLLIG